MQTASSTVTTSPRPSPKSRRSLILVFCCTIFGAAAQVLMKTGANNLASHGLLGMVTNPPLMLGYCLYGISTVLLVLALREGALSLLYPVIALTYVWVTLLSFTLFDERFSVYKLIGITAIVSGVGILGRDARE
jgi:multidrug transporter EmrE-like cation transporter